MAKCQSNIVESASTFITNPLLVHFVFWMMLGATVGLLGYSLDFEIFLKGRYIDEQTDSIR